MKNFAARIFNNAVISAQFRCVRVYMHVFVCADEFQERKTFNLCHDIKLQSRWNSANKWLIQPILLNKSVLFEMARTTFFFSCDSLSTFGIVTDSMFEKIKTIVCFFSRRPRVVFVAEQIKHFSVDWNEIEPHIMQFFYHHYHRHHRRRRLFFPTRINYACESKRWCSGGGGSASNSKSNIE